ncbi:MULTISPECIES: aa3-type cytochrome oxidase subunit IV [Corynebacterium]|uniref:aa3-type cytochrome oxidase subunit IV n=1 Tax=Corynebacterium TaxID=1716 RepID=UPI000EE98607|nr:MULTISPECIES: cytochrome c oxidase subunit 4 [Corynebacterium]MDN6099152.1 cytochrome c oxidase subunit 4 [Corynebacterium flavescens]MDN6236640.1 cytochrome c oxidase subunit 4 [Corynebacterium flavescens]MDN6431328.1 cytochrome c oxidase subunit 4 [Corynebacterium flavescens]MDN6476188.1 cytochrome c oxidase subunit 4 [Corynebacterium flavescens]MDN6531171.1 cytochrome c oxidase subunit 4 [Corynebacterium flavescens]
MRATSMVFYSIATYLFVSLIVYIFGLNLVKDDGYLYGPEWAGIVALALSFLLCIMLGVYLHFTDKRVDIAPEDWEEAETEDGAGILGFFSPSSIWPLAMTGSVAVLGLGIIFLYFWLIALGAVCLIASVTGLSLQYGLPKEKH